MIKSEVLSTLEQYEPRISVVDIQCKPDFNNNAYQVELHFKIVGREDAPIAVDFFLERTR